MFQKSVQGFAILLLLTAGAVSAQTTTVHVVPTSGSPTASGSSLLLALAGITDASISKPYVLKLDAAIYDLSTSQLVMKPYVDIEGSGQGSTIIQGPGNGDTSYLTGIIKTASSAELRDLQVVSAGSGQASSIGIFVPPGANTSIRDVTVTAGSANYNWGIRSLAASPSIQDVTLNVLSSSTYQSVGIGTTGSSANPILKDTVITISGTGSYAYGIYSDGISTPRELRDLEITLGGSNSSNYGIYVDSYGSSQTFLLTNSIVTVSGGTFNFGLVFYGGTFGIFNVKASVLTTTGTNSYGIFASSSNVVSVTESEVSGTNAIQASGTIVKAGASRLAGTVTGGTLICTGAYSANYVALTTTCH
jgi:hypothetical protein